MIRARRNMPLWRFQLQRARAKQRGIGWELTFEQWFAIWTESGHWHQRGKTLGSYVMARHGDRGPYAVGNVSIVTVEQNIADFDRGPRDFPRGVTPHGKRFVARRSIKGTATYLGCFPTPEEAHQAYLRAA